MLHVPEVRDLAVAAVAAVLAKSEKWVRDRMYLGRLGESARDLVREGRLPLTHAREIAKISDPELRDRLATDYAVGGDMASEVEPGRLDDLREMVSRRVFSLNVVPWRLDRPFAGMIECDGCPNNSTSQPGLFDAGDRASRSETKPGSGMGNVYSEYANGAVCTDHTCYAIKSRAAQKAIRSEANRLVKSASRGKITEKPAETIGVSTDLIIKQAETTLALQKNAPKDRVQHAKAPPTPRQRLHEVMVNKRHLLGIKNTEVGRQFEPVLAKALGARPGLWAMYRVLLEAKPVQALRSHADTGGAPPALLAQVKHLFSLLSRPSWEALVEIERECGRRFSLVEGRYDMPSGHTAALAEALGLKVPEQASWLDILPEDLHSEYQAWAKEQEEAKAKKGKAKGKR